MSPFCNTPKLRRQAVTAVVLLVIFITVAATFLSTLALLAFHSWLI